MQQVPLLVTATGGKSILQHVLLVLGLEDDVKAHYRLDNATLCGSHWTQVFQVSELEI